MQFSLNYVWIQAVRMSVPDCDNKITCPIPQELMDNINATAIANPDSYVSIWVDICGPGYNSPRILGSLNEEVEQSNVKFCSLDDIPVYKVDPLFTKKHEDFEDPYDPIWQQLDLARLYVLRHQLLSNPDEGAIYIDNDLIFPDLDGERFQNILAKHNICFGRFFRSKDTEYGTFENQFFAVGQGFGKRYLMSHLIPYTQDSIRQSLNGWDAIWSVVQEPDLYKTLDIRDIDEVMIDTYPIHEHVNIKRSYQKPNRALAQSSPPQP